MGAGILWYYVGEKYPGSDRVHLWAVFSMGFDRYAKHWREKDGPGKPYRIAADGALFDNFVRQLDLSSLSNSGSKYSFPDKIPSCEATGQISGNIQCGVRTMYFIAVFGSGYPGSNRRYGGKKRNFHRTNRSLGRPAEGAHKSCSWNRISKLLAWRTY